MIAKYFLPDKIKKLIENEEISNVMEMAGVLQEKKDLFIQPFLNEQYKKELIDIAQKMDNLSEKIDVKKAENFINLLNLLNLLNLPENQNNKNKDKDVKILQNMAFAGIIKETLSYLADYISSKKVGGEQKWVETQGLVEGIEKNKTKALRKVFNKLNFKEYQQNPNITENNQSRDSIQEVLNLNTINDGEEINKI